MSGYNLMEKNDEGQPLRRSAALEGGGETCGAGDATTV